MTDQVNFTRRQLLIASGGVTGVALATSARAAALPPALHLGDPKAALDAYVRLRGSTAAETVFQPYEGDIFLVADGKVGIPLVGFKGIQKSHWAPDGRGGYSNKDYDVGFYVDYGSREIIREWDNPVTGKRVEVFHYRGGPSGGHFKVGQGGGDVYGDHGGRWSVLGDQVWHTSSSWGERPNLLKPSDWPLASSGETLLGSMSLTFAAPLAQIADPRVSQASALQMWTNSVSWMPWMEMGQRPGFNLWRWIGAKGASPDRLDPKLVSAVEAVCPGFVRSDGIWTEPTSGRLDYMRLKKGLSLTR